MSKPAAAGLVLTSGGARGAYQAGALRAVAELLDATRLPFPVLSGVSAGSINAAFLACNADNFADATERLCHLWANLRPNDVFLTSGLTLSRTGIAWLLDLGLGGWIGSGRGQSLLKTAPLEKVLRDNLDFQAFEKNVAEGLVRGLALTATNYYSGSAVTFFEGAGDIEPWVRSTRFSMRAKIAVEHVMASAAIPVFFPAVRVGKAYYGDGCVRMNTPLSPAIHMGADRVLAIGVRHERSIEKVTDLNNRHSGRYPFLAEVGGILLNAMFLDALEGDMERMLRINQTISMIPAERRAAHPSALRHVPVMALKPSKDLGALALEVMKDFSIPVRHFLKGLGTSNESGGDLLSYLAFDSAYTSRLVALGYGDAMASRDELVKFMGQGKSRRHTA